MNGGRVYHLPASWILHTWLNFTDAIQINDAVCLVFCIDNQIKKAEWINSEAKIVRLQFRILKTCPALICWLKPILLQTFNEISPFSCEKWKAFELVYEWCKLAAFYVHNLARCTSLNEKVKRDEISNGTNLGHFKFINSPSHWFSVS